MAVDRDLTPPPMMEEQPAPGKRVRQVDPAFAGTGVYHALYLPKNWQARPERPVNWEATRTWPVIVEYAGNQWETSLGTPEGSSLGYGLSGGVDYIWLCLPYVDTLRQANALTWWGDVEATVAYCRSTVREVCERCGGDSASLLLAGFSRGAIACNYLGLWDDAIASLWRGFICHSHYDGVRDWPYPASDRASAATRLSRLRARPQFISHERSPESALDMTRRYLAEACPEGDFTFAELPSDEHTDTWVLRDSPERRLLRQWLQRVLAG